MRSPKRAGEKHARESKGETDDQGQKFLERKSIVGNKKNSASSGQTTRGCDVHIFFVFSAHTGNPLRWLR
jgi:hypothetical protein